MMYHAVTSLYIPRSSCYIPCVGSVATNYRHNILRANYCANVTEVNYRLRASACKYTEAFPLLIPRLLMHVNNCMLMKNCYRRNSVTTTI